ncbi:MAG: 3-methyl-2-oxobutanoate dehydrogenase subunit beta [Planctomycetes bacterium]|nr:3-methyl-2-oxobutanoate dehydrogenase subunit beta [Planctomycetota bacterium]
MKFNIPQEELMYSGHVACPGCGASLAMRLALKGLGKKTMLVLPACCWSIIDGPFPYSSTKIPLLHTAFETGGSAASGVRAALDVLGKKDITVMTWAGDGGTMDIGLQALSGAAERNENFIYTCYDNEAYMNTGIQRSSGTPWGAWTTTTPNKKEQPKKDIMAIIAAHKIPYAATASVAYPDDLIAKYKKARKIKGTRFIHIFAPCPPGWKSLPEESIKLARMAVQARSFPLYEVENGMKYTLNRPNPNEKPIPIKEYLQRQGRFRNLNDQSTKLIQKNVDQNWQNLLNKLDK